MIPIDDYKKWLPQMKELAPIYLDQKSYITYKKMTHEEVEKELGDLLHQPIAKFTPVNELYFRGKWAEVFQLKQVNHPIKVLEIASGDADMIPQVLACQNSDSTYITANMNKKLNYSLLNKIKDLSIKKLLIDDDAMNVGKYVEASDIDFIVFQHSVNDVIQGMLCGREGIDTVYADWMETLPQMIELLQVEVANNTLEEHVKSSFLELISILLTVLKEDGLIAIHHYMFQLDLDWGYPRHLFEFMIPMVRNWLEELDSCMEISFDGFESNWWMFLRKV